MAAQSLTKQAHIEVPAHKAEYLEALATLSTESLKILASKAKKPGMEQKLKMYQNFI